MYKIINIWRISFKKFKNETSDSFIYTTQDYLEGEIEGYRGRYGHEKDANRLLIFDFKLRMFSVIFWVVNENNEAHYSI